MRLKQLKVPAAALAFLGVLSLTGCGTGFFVDFSAPETTRTPSPSITSTASPTNPVYVFEYDTPGQSLTQLRRAEALLVRALARKGEARDRLRLEACRMLGSALSRTGGDEWRGSANTQSTWAVHYCYTDHPRESLRSLRIVMSVLEAKGVTPEPYPSKAP